MIEAVDGAPTPSAWVVLLATGYEVRWLEHDTCRRRPLTWFEKLRWLIFSRVPTP